MFCPYLQSEELLEEELEALNTTSGSRWDLVTPFKKWMIDFLQVMMMMMMMMMTMMMIMMLIIKMKKKTMMTMTTTTTTMMMMMMMFECGTGVGLPGGVPDVGLAELCLRPVRHVLRPLLDALLDLLPRHTTRQGAYLVFA
jgi:hypothetical protein